MLERRESMIAGGFNTIEELIDQNIKGNGMYKSFNDMMSYADTLRAEGDIIASQYKKLVDAIYVEQYGDTAVRHYELKN